MTALTEVPQLDGKNPFRSMALWLARLKSSGPVLLVIVGVVGGLALWWAWREDHAANPMSVEVAKTSLQVLAVAILGGLATFAFSEIQQSRERWRRQGDDLRALADETIAAYNKVKGVRHLLRASISGHDQSTYDEKMQALNDLQLEFERLKRDCPFTGITTRSIKVRYHGGAEPVSKTVKSLSEDYEAIESFLNSAFSCYESNTTIPSSLDDLLTHSKGHSGLHSFLATKSFRSAVSSHINVVLEVLLGSRSLGPPRFARHS